MLLATLLGSVIEASTEFWNAYGPSEDTLLGNVIEVRSQVANAPVPTLCKPLPMIVTEAKLLAESKAPSPIVFTLSGIMIEVRDVHKKRRCQGWQSHRRQ